MASMLFSNLPKNLCVRTFASGTATDPIQKLFLDKLKEYNQKAGSTKDGLVDADEKTRKGLSDEMERVKRNYEVKDGEEGKITVSFNDANFKLDSINQNDW
jgi:F-type H+-transporting ATPase subunit 6